MMNIASSYQNHKMNNHTTARGLTACPTCDEVLPRQHSAARDEDNIRPAAVHGHQLGPGWGEHHPAGEAGGDPARGQFTGGDCTRRGQRGTARRRRVTSRASRQP